MAQQEFCLTAGKFVPVSRQTMMNVREDLMFSHMNIFQTALLKLRSACLDSPFEYCHLKSIHANKKKTEYTWEYTYYITENKIVNIDDLLEVGSKMTPILEEMMMTMEKRKINMKGKIANFVTYLDDKFGHWKESEKEPKEGAKELKAENKVIQLGLETKIK